MLPICRCTLWEVLAMHTIISRSWLVACTVLLPVLSSGCASDYDEIKAQNQQLQSQNQQLQSQKQQLQSQNQQLQSQNQQLEAHVGRLQSAMAYTVNSDMLFKSGSWEMSDRGKDIIGKLAQKLAPAQQDKVLVSGYTDNAPIGQKLKQQGVITNEELSQKRADAVMQYLISQGVKKDMVAARGFGEADPVVPNDTPQGRAQNRRVVLSVAGQTAEGSSAPPQ
jgi:chemotaxis protein MotB